jgi:signal transduction histidine kinase
MTREIAQSHGGSIQAHSTPGEGSSFTIRLPLQPRP